MLCIDTYIITYHMKTYNTAAKTAAHFTDSGLLNVHLEEQGSALCITGRKPD